jgi:hypothetical protein
MKVGDSVSVMYRGVADAKDMEITGSVRKVEQKEKGTLVLVKMADGSGYRSFYLEKAKVMVPS